MGDPDTIIVKRSEFLADSHKYMKMSAGQTQVHITSDETGKVLMVLGTGPISDELAEKARIALEEIEKI